jgi:hypothetical protein
MKMSFWESSNILTFMREKEKLGEHNKDGGWYASYEHCSFPMYAWTGFIWLRKGTSGGLL